MRSATRLSDKVPAGVLEPAPFYAATWPAIGIDQRPEVDQRCCRATPHEDGCGTGVPGRRDEPAHLATGHGGRVVLTALFSPEPWGQLRTERNVSDSSQPRR